MINDLKKIMLAGIGTMATAYEKTDSFINDMVQKGKITVEDGKELSEELKRSVSEKTGEATKIISSKLDEFKPMTKEDMREVMSECNESTQKEIYNLRKKVEDLEKKIDEKK